jgi:dTDP-4-dehydrorhamnose 3,5-epimerase
VYFFEIPKFEDGRGWLMELFRTDELEFAPEMAYVSQTLPGVMRGPHEHREQTDFFVFIGPGEFELHLWSREIKLHEVHKVGESRPRAVVVPPGIIHGYKCVSDHAGLVFNAPDALYAGPGKMYPVDEIRHEEDQTDVEMLMRM